MRVSTKPPSSVPKHPKPSPEKSMPSVSSNVIIVSGQCTIVGNKQTFGMIEGFYGVTGEQYLIKDGDFLALGRHKLRFYLTPMVHWPETMMTFDETDGILFSGDGFGVR